MLKVIVAYRVPQEQITGEHDEHEPRHDQEDPSAAAGQVLVVVAEEGAAAVVLLAVPDAELDAAGGLLLEVVPLLLLLDLLLESEALALLTDHLPGFLDLFVHEGLEALALGVQTLLGALSVVDDVEDVVSADIVFEEVVLLWGGLLTLLGDFFGLEVRIGWLAFIVLPVLALALGLGPRSLLLLAPALAPSGLTGALGHLLGHLPEALSIVGLEVEPTEVGAKEISFLGFRRSECLALALALRAA
jgi:hypothetical protein